MTAVGSGIGGQSRRARRNAQRPAAPEAAASTAGAPAGWSFAGLLPRSAVHIVLPHERKAQTWQIIQDALQRSVSTPKDLKILFRDVYAATGLGADARQGAPRPRGLVGFLARDANSALREQFFSSTLPFLQFLVLRQLETLFPGKKGRIPLLEQGRPGTLTLSRLQAACLLACCFFSLHRDHVDPWHGDRDGRLPDGHARNEADFAWLLASDQNAKIHCILHYFARIAEEVRVKSPALEHKISFHRRVLSETEFEPLKDSLTTSGSRPLGRLGNAPLCPVECVADGVIEADADAIQLDFANRFIGGSVLGHGCVQEEIRFMVSTECLLSLLFCPVMSTAEAIVILGAQQYSAYSGYGSGFRWSGDHVDAAAATLDSQGRPRIAILAIDAKPGGGRSQFTPNRLLRELVKAYTGFSTPASELAADYTHLATGNWGCGVFGGEIDVKFAIQWVAASCAGRSIRYYPFTNPRAKHVIPAAVRALMSATPTPTANQLWRFVLDHGDKRVLDAILEVFGEAMSSGDDGAGDETEDLESIDDLGSLSPATVEALLDAAAADMADASSSDAGAPAL